MSNSCESRVLDGFPIYTCQDTVRKAIAEKCKAPTNSQKLSFQEIIPLRERDPFYPFTDAQTLKREILCALAASVLPNNTEDVPRIVNLFACDGKPYIVQEEATAVLADWFGGRLVDEQIPDAVFLETSYRVLYAASLLTAVFGITHRNLTIRSVLEVGGNGGGGGDTSRFLLGNFAHAHGVAGFPDAETTVSLENFTSAVELNASPGAYTGVPALKYDLLSFLQSCKCLPLSPSSNNFLNGAFQALDDSALDWKDEGTPLRFVQDLYARQAVTLKPNLESGQIVSSRHRFAALQKRYEIILKLF